MGKRKSTSDSDVLTMEQPEEMDYEFGYKNPSARKAFINRIKKYVRSSMEYKDYILFLRENVGMDACAFFNNINKTTSKSIRIEVHHEPLRMHDLVNIMLRKYEKEGIKLNDLAIAKEVMKLHYSNLVGLVPLSKTLHEVAHNSNKLVIPAYMIYGNYKEFLEKYDDYIEDEEFKKIETMIRRTKELKEDSFDCIEKKFEYIEVDGFTLPKQLSEDNTEVIIEDTDMEGVETEAA